MTTQVHIFNNGPDVVEVHTSSPFPVEIVPHQGKDFYVYPGNEPTVKEKAVPVEAPVEAPAETVVPVELVS